MGSIGDDPMKPLEGKNVLVTGGTGSLGRVLVRRLLAGEMGQPKQVLVFSRDETRQHNMRLQYGHRPVATEEIIYRGAQGRLASHVGDDFFRRDGPKRVLEAHVVLLRLIARKY